MELYVSSIPLLIYEGTLGELETYNYFKLHPMRTSYINTPQALLLNQLFLECSYGRPHRLLFQASVSFLHFLRQI